jgi:RNA polymerase sigma-70 factor (ECF subfamily)
MSAVGDNRAEQAEALLALYDRSLPQVYGYLVRRTGNPTIAEDLAAETFLAAVASIRSSVVQEVTAAWLVGIARHKLVDHWRREERDTRRLQAVAAVTTEVDDPWDEHLDATVARQVVATLTPQHRAALTLRYADGLPVREVARLLDRTEHATEALLVRSRRAFRTAYLALDPSEAPMPHGGEHDDH